MSYYKNKQQEYKQLIETVAAELNINVLIIEKDLIQSLFLYEISKENKHIVFKGGTSLSKAYKAINRFSEDIDLSFDHKPTESEKRDVFNTIFEISKKLDLNCINFNNLKSRYSYNKYVFEYDSLFLNNKQEIIIETNFYIPVYPINNLIIHSYVYDFMIDNKIETMEWLNINQFTMNVQSIDRTFIDKVFAICDYYLESKSERNSRHLYDIYKIIKYIDFKEDLYDLIKKVRKDRSLSKNNPSASIEINIQDLLKKIQSERFYLNDYKNITTKLLYEDISYKKCIDEGLNKIIELKFWE